jgi:CRP-like cAMP-binding protein
MAVVFSGAYGPGPRCSLCPDPDPKIWRQELAGSSSLEAEAVATGTQQALALTDLANARVASTDLCKALLPTQFGQTFGPRASNALLSGFAGRSIHPQGSILRLRGANDGMYVILEGKVEVLSGPDQTQRLRIVIEEGQGIPNGKVEDLLNKYCAIRQNAYVIVQVGAKKFRTPVVLAQAGEDLSWSFVGHLPYDGESDVQFAVVECGFKSEAPVAVGSLRTDCLGERQDGNLSFQGSIGLRKPTQVEEVSISRHGPDGFQLDSQKQPERASGAGSLRVSVSVITDESQASQEAALAGTTSKGKSTPATPKSPSRASSTPMTPQRNPQHCLPALPTTPQLCSSEDSFSTSQVESEIPQRSLGRVLGRGQYFGEKPGGVVYCLERCQFLMVPRCHVASSLNTASEEESGSRIEFLQNWLPGAESLDSETFRCFSNAFRRQSFPKGYVFCAERRSKLQELRRVFLIASGELRDLGDTTAAPPDPEWEPGSRAHCCNVGHFEAGSAVLARRIGKGAIVGFHSALFGMPEPRTVVAATRVEAWVIDTVDFPVVKWPQPVVSKLASIMDRRKANLPNVSERSRRRQTQLRSLGSASLPNLRSSMQRQSLAANLTCLKPPKPVQGKRHTRVSESWQYVTAFC